MGSVVDGYQFKQVEKRMSSVYLFQKELEREIKSSKVLRGT